MNLEIDHEISRCVKCGLCLPECPTYRLTLSESYSPRGRIALAAALYKQQITPDAQFQQRMNSCLLCRRCERVCPSGVKLGRIMDEARFGMKNHSSNWQALLNKTVANPVRLRNTLASVQWLRPCISSIPDLAPAVDIADYYPATRNPSDDRVPAADNSVALFKGCTSEAIEPHTLQAAIKLLTYAGQNVHIPTNQGCCGALHAHAGDKQQAAALGATNARAFDNHSFDTLLSIASGCGAYLADDTQLPTSHQDICTFLAQPDIIRHLQFDPLKAVVAVHIPCSLENVLCTAQSVLDLLARIPNLELRVLSKNQCCGAAGTYFITHSKTARELRRPLIEQIKHIRADYLVTSNIGCALFLSNGLGEEPPLIMHPISLLAQQLTGN